MNSFKPKDKPEEVISESKPEEETCAEVVKFTKDFAFSPNGYEVVHYRAGEEREVSKTCAEIARKVGAVSSEKKKPELNKSLGGAPQNKAV